MDFGDLDAAIAQLTGPSQGSLEPSPTLMSSLSELHMMESSTLEFRDEEDAEASQESDEEEDIPEEVGHWMDEALQESGLPQSHEDFLYEPAMEGISLGLSQDLQNFDSQESLIQEMQDQLGMQFDPDADLRDPNGSTRKVDKRRGPKPRHRAHTSVPERLAGVFGQANLAYTMADYPEAMRLLHQIIKEAPQSSQPWLQLALIHEELGDASKAMHTYLVAAHLIVKDAELWRKIGTMSSTLGNRDQAIYCWSKAIRQNPEDCESLMERSLAYAELKQYARAVEGFHAVLVLVPHHMPTIKKLAEIYVELNNPQSALELFEDAIDAPPEETELEPLDEDEEIIGHYTMGAVSAPSRIGFEELNMMCELYFEISEYEKAAYTLVETIQRLKMTTFAPGSDVDLEIEKLDIPIEIRVKLGIARLHQDFAEEAKLHFRRLYAIPPKEYPELYFEVVDTYIAKRHFPFALNVLEIMTKEDETDVTETWTRMANCHQNMGNLETAVELYENVLDENPGDFDAKFALSTIYEELGRSEVARQLLEEAEALSMQAQIAAKEKEEEEERRIAAMSSISNRKSMNKDRMLQLSEEKNRIRETQELYNKASHLLKNLEDASSRRDCLRILRKLLSRFQSTREFYPQDRSKKFTGYRLAIALRHVHDPVLAEAIKGEALHGISFDEWYQLFIDFAKVATMEGKFKEAQDMLSSALNANVFYHSVEKEGAIRLHMISAAIHAGDIQTVSDVVRWFCLERALTNDVYRLYTACLSQGNDAAAIFASNPNQKHFHRQIRALEKEFKKNPRSNDFKNPVLHALYGQICSAARSFLDAIQHYTKAYRLAPHDPMINLSLGIAHIQRSMQRKSQNRHHHVVCGFTYIFNYQEIVGETPESNYNIGRAFHHLGLYQLASQYYDKVLSAAGQDESQELSREAAYNLSLIYAVSGSNALAQNLMKNFLVY